MPLIVEDGSNVAGCNTYVTIAIVRADAALRGITVPQDDGALTAQIIAAMDYLATYEYRLQGRRTFGAMQAQAWPRSGVVAFKSRLPSNVIPADIVKLQSYLACIAGTIDLYGNQDTRAITKETIGPLDTEYSTTSGATFGPLLPTVSAMLKPYLNAGVGMISSVRV